jgi:site-specific DNA-adenine methylase
MPSPNNNPLNSFMAQLIQDKAASTAHVSLVTDNARITRVGGTSFSISTKTVTILRKDAQVRKVGSKREREREWLFQVLAHYGRCFISLYYLNSQGSFTNPVTAVTDRGLPLAKQDLTPAVRSSSSTYS